MTTKDALGRHRIYATHGRSGFGKDMIMAAVVTMSEGRLEPLRRYTTRKLRPGDHYQSGTMEQMQDWMKTEDACGFFNAYPGTTFCSRRSEVDAQLKRCPILSHYLVGAAKQMREEGYTIILSELKISHRTKKQMPGRVHERAEADAKYEAEVAANQDVFNGETLTNDFSLDGPTIYLCDGMTVPRGAALAAYQHLAFITRSEGWNPSFLEPTKAYLGL